MFYRIRAFSLEFVRLYCSGLYHSYIMLLNRKRSLCECDLMFAKQFREAFKSWKVNYHIFLYGWSPSADCVPSSSTGQEKVLSAT